MTALGFPRFADIVLTLQHHTWSGSSKPVLDRPLDAVCQNMGGHHPRARSDQLGTIGDQPGRHDTATDQGERDLICDLTHQAQGRDNRVMATAASELMRWMPPPNDISYAMMVSSEPKGGHIDDDT
ncbi:hypothetical protein, partial [Paracoccus yeei]